MDPLSSVVAAIVGLAVGIAGTLAVTWSGLRAGRAAARSTDPDVESSGLEVLGVLAATVILIDERDDLLRASPEAYSFGLVRNDQLVQAEVRELVRQVRADGHVRDEELVLARSALEGSGRVRLEVRAAPLAGGIVLLMVTDTTAAMRLEETRRDFVANISHELKTPVGAIALLAETVEECADEADTVRHFAGRMQVESARLASLVRDIIDLSRLQEPDALRDPDLVELDDVVREAVDRVRVIASDRAISVVTGGTTGVRVYGDAAMLSMALQNLLDNAQRHSFRAGSVNVGVSVHDDHVRIAVVDHGEGIAPEHLPRVFERFYRADPARSRETGGTGLGLSIVKHVVSDHGGRVEVWSAPGKGSTFTIVLPIADEPDLPVGAPPAQSRFQDKETS